MGERSYSRWSFTRINGREELDLASKIELFDLASKIEHVSRARPPRAQDTGHAVREGPLGARDAAASHAPTGPSRGPRGCPLCARKRRAHPNAEGRAAPNAEAAPPKGASAERFSILQVKSS